METISSKLNCLSCKAPLDVPWLADCPDDYLGTPFRVTYYECPNCRLVQQAPVPADMKMSLSMAESAVTLVSPLHVTGTAMR